MSISQTVVAKRDLGIIERHQDKSGIWIKKELRVNGEWEHLVGLRWGNEGRNCMHQCLQFVTGDRNSGGF